MKKRPLISRKEKKEMQEAGNRRVDNHHAIVRAGKEWEVYFRKPLPIRPYAQRLAKNSWHWPEKSRTRTRCSII